MAAEPGALRREHVIAPRKRLLGIDNRLLPPLLITSILVTAHLSFGILEGWERTALAIITAIGAEMIMGRATYGVWPHPASAYISGISAGILVRSPFYWPYFLTSLISITSKYVLRVRGPPPVESDELRCERRRLSRAGDGRRASACSGATSSRRWR
jgi:hypothetical protein